MDSTQTDSNSLDRLSRITGFFPYLLVIFLNAFVDLGHKIVVQNTVFKVYDGNTQIILTAIVNGLILLPFILLFSPSGFLSDRFRKPYILRLTAFLAIPVTLVITFAYYQGWFELAFAMTFLLAVQSALYSPAKYGYIKELVGQDRLAQMNAIVQAVTIVAILLGIFVFSMLFEAGLAGHYYHDARELLPLIAPLGWLLVGFAIIEFVLSLRLPVLRPRNDSKTFVARRYFTGQYLRTNLKTIRTNRNIWLSIVGLSVFWGLSQVVLASFPAFAKETLQISNTVIIQGLLASSGIGIIIGSLIAGKASKHYIETGFVAIGAVGVVISLFLIPRLDSVLLLGLDILAMGLFGGMFIVPLNAIIQFQAPADQLGTVLAGNNWVQNIVMLGFLAMTILIAQYGIDSVGLFHLLTLIALAGAIYTVWYLPQSMIRLIISHLFAGRYRIRVEGFENLPGHGGVLMLGNHISWLDWAMIQIACPRPVHFVMHRAYYERWYLKWFLDIFGVIPIACGQSKEALAHINQLLKEGEVVCMFPEGAISRNGQLGVFKTGFERTVEGVEGVILPFYLRGLWGSYFSRSSSRLRSLRHQGLRRDIIVAFGPAIDIHSKAPEVKNRVFDLSIEAWQGYTRTLDPAALAWIRTVKAQGKQLCMRDAVGGIPLSGHRALSACLGFSHLIRKRSREQNIGLLLPTSSASMLTNMAVLLLGRTVVNLNYTASVAALCDAADKAELKSLYTSRRFIDKLEKRGIDLQPLLDRLEVFYLEELRDEIGMLKKITLLLMVRLLPGRLLYWLFGTAVDIHQPAAILFSSGSEGSPKGVMLSHQNIMGNIKQVADVLDVQEHDVIMASLPQFHAFGLTVTGLLPLIEGIPVIFHSDPADVLNIARAIARHQVTIFFATSTFLRLHVRNTRIHPIMLESLRLVVAGAEKMNAEVREGFERKFNKTIYEGYGTTETTPVASVNLPDRLDTSDWQIQIGHKPGTVGLPLPGSSFRIVDPDSLEELPANEDGLILIGGTQVMLGYLDDEEKTREVIVELDGKRWYKSGDKGHLDEDGFLTIVDRYSRFAKIGGEMISLGAIEDSLSSQLPDEIEITTTAIADGRKDEKIVLLFAGHIDEADIDAALLAASLKPLMKPSVLIKLEQIPRLGSGKTDFRRAREIAIAKAGS